MHFRLVRPVKRKGSINPQFTQRIPADVKSRAAGLKLSIPVGGETVSITLGAKAQHVRLSLRSSTPSIVRQRQGEVVAYLETVWQALRSSEPVRLTHRQAVALAKELYDAWSLERPEERTVSVTQVPASSDFVMDDGFVQMGPEDWEAAAEKLEQRDPLGREPEEYMEPLVRKLALAKGIVHVDEPSLRMVGLEFVKAMQQAFKHRAKQASGDYRPDPDADRFPEWSPPPSTTVAHRGRHEVSLKGLVESWWNEAQKAGRARSTYDSYAASIARLGLFLGHDDAARVTPADIVAFKDKRLADGVSAKTVGDSDIAGLRSIFAWAVANKKLPSNPAEDIKVTRPKAIRTREKALTMDEAQAVLVHARDTKRGSERLKTHAAKRWVPWLCAYTGARLGEMVQLRKEDIRKDGEVWAVRINPEAHTVKDKEARDVVLHAHLVETGFIDFVDQSAPGYLFLTAPKDGDVRGVWRSIKNRVTEFVREVVTDRRVAPNHGWRHLFKTLGREADIADTVLDGICGHAAKSVGASYGGVSLKAQKQAMQKFPRFELEAGSEV